MTPDQQIVANIRAEMADIWPQFQKALAIVTQLKLLTDSTYGTPEERGHLWRLTLEHNPVTFNG